MSNAYNKSQFFPRSLLSHWTHHVNVTRVILLISWCHMGLSSGCQEVVTRETSTFYFEVLSKLCKFKFSPSSEIFKGQYRWIVQFEWVINYDSFIAFFLDELIQYKRSISWINDANVRSKWSFSVSLKYFFKNLKVFWFTQFNTFEYSPF